MEADGSGPAELGDLFIYYRTSDEAPDLTAGKIQCVLHEAAAELGSRGRLYRRDEPGRRRITWMEIFERLDRSLEARLSVVLERSSRSHGLRVERHYEWFKPVEIDDSGSGARAIRPDP